MDSKGVVNKVLVLLSPLKTKVNVGVVLQGARGGGGGYSLHTYKHTYIYTNVHTNMFFIWSHIQ